MSKRLGVMLIINIMVLWVLGIMAIKTDEKIMDAVEALNHKQELSAQVDGAFDRHLDRVDNHLWKHKDRLDWLCSTGMTEREAIDALYDEVFLSQHVPAAKHSTVYIDAGRWSGSGVVISEYMVATAKHVVEGAEEFTITFDNGMKISSSDALYHESYDVAIIFIEESYVDPAVCKSSEGLELGQRIFVVGSPFGDLNFNCVTEGIISGLDRDWSKGNTYGWSVAFTADASGGPGNSGGPLFDMNGNVRGLLVGGYTSTCVVYMPVDLFLNDLEILEDMYFIENHLAHRADFLLNGMGWYWNEPQDEYYDDYYMYME
jgi:S1-C subfamily serine protease